MDAEILRVLSRLWGGIAFGSALLAQRYFPHIQCQDSWRINTAFWAVGILLTTITCGACTVAAAYWAATHRFGVLHMLPLPWWCTVPVTIATLDAVSYGWHRANHRVPLLWRFHQVHHSDPACTVSTALRFHPGELLLSFPVRGTAVLFLGAPPIAVIVFESVFTTANIFEHGNITMPWSLERILERVCITPGLHRRHHSQQREDMDGNFGTIFVWWDRGFGTHRPSASKETVPIGLPDVGDVSTFRHALLLPILRPPQ